MNWLGRLARRERGERARGLVIDRPGATIYALGDVHGCHRLYRAMEEAILRDPGRAPGSAPVMILLGDMIDRGPESARLIETLCAPPPAGLERFCLAGNHEAMALDFLAAPDPAAPWLGFGGRETLLSYGIAPGALRSRRLAGQVAAAIPAGHLGFLRSLPHLIRAGGHYFSHAGPDPTLGPDAQGTRQLLWSGSFLGPDLPAPSWLGEGLAVQGHVVVEEVERRGWRLCTDTGAYATGRLSAVRLAPGSEPSVLTVG